MATLRYRVHLRSDAAVRGMACNKHTKLMRVSLKTNKRPMLAFVDCGVKKRRKILKLPVM